MEATLELQELKSNPIEQALIKENVTEKVIKELQQFKSLTIKGIEDKEGYKAANEARITCKNLRVLAEKVCKAGREEAITIQKQWIAKEKEVTGQISEVEDYLKTEQARIDNEKENIRIAAEKAKADRINSRVKSLFDNGCTFDGVNYSLGELTINNTQIEVMDDGIFTIFLDRVKVEHDGEVKLKEYKKKQDNQINERCGQLAAMGLRFNFQYESYLLDDINIHTTEISLLNQEEWDVLINKISSEIKRREDEKKAEADRLKAEREELEKQQAAFKAEQEKARKEAEEKQAAINAENLRIANEQREKELEISRQQEALQKEKDEAAAKERQRLQAIEDKRIAAEKEALRIEAARLENLRLEAERLQKEKDQQEATRIEQEQQALLAPDKEKLQAFSDALGKVTCQPLNDANADKIYADALILVTKIQAHISKGIKSLTKAELFKQAA